MTVTRMATAARLIPVTVDTFDTPNVYGFSKNDDNYGMATATRLIPVTVDILDTP